LHGPGHRGRRLLRDARDARSPDHADSAPWASLRQPGVRSLSGGRGCHGVRVRVRWGTATAEGAGHPPNLSRSRPGLTGSLGDRTALPYPLACRSMDKAGQLGGGTSWGRLLSFSHTSCEGNPRLRREAPAGHPAANCGRGKCSESRWLPSSGLGKWADSQLCDWITSGKAQGAPDRKEG